ncbi:hypothetical protein ACFL04_04545 [Patescibacteria group bacterium]
MKSNQKEDFPSACPNCGKSTIKKLTYGMPVFVKDNGNKYKDRLFGKDRMHLGCIDDGFNWHCTNCSAEWDELDEKGVPKKLEFNNHLQEIYGRLKMYEDDDKKYRKVARISIILNASLLAALIYFFLMYK